MLLQRKANDHDLLFVISNLSSAGTPAGEDCSHPEPFNRYAPRNSPTAPLCPRMCPFRLHPIHSPHQQHNSKHITPYFQTGSLQVAVSKTLRRQDFLPCSKRIPPERFRYSPRTYRPPRADYADRISEISAPTLLRLTPVGCVATGSRAILCGNATQVTGEAPKRNPRRGISSQRFACRNCAARRSRLFVINRPLALRNGP